MFNLFTHPSKVLDTVSTDFNFEKDFILDYKDIEIFEKDFISYFSSFVNAIGLSSNQIGVLKRFFVIGCESFGNFKQPIVMWNPLLIWESSKQSKILEGCLSFPDREIAITRPATIRATWQDNTGRVSTLNLRGLEARCFMHELDHLNGITFDKLRVDNHRRIG